MYKKPSVLTRFGPAVVQICTDADHVNGKGLLKQGTGSTGKKHEERESKKGNKTDNWK